MLLSLLSRPVPRDTGAILVSVVLRGIGEQTVAARLGVMHGDSTLYLPVPDLNALLGTSMQGQRWLTLLELSRRWPTLAVFWSPSDLTVSIEDDQEVLPATMAAHDKQRVANQDRRVIASSGFGASVSANSAGARREQVSYAWKGRVFLQASRQTSGAVGMAPFATTSYGVSVAPTAGLFLSASAASSSSSTTPGVTTVQVSAMFNRGPLWTRWAYAPGQRLLGQALLTVSRHVALFASSDRTASVTIRSSLLALQAGWRQGISSLRVSVGVSMLPSPFGVSP